MSIRPTNSLPLFASILLVILLHACANIVRPGGGPRDQEGPVIVEADPPSGTLNFQGDIIDLYFDEFLKPGNYSKELFISPVMATTPLVTVKNKRLRIQFREPLRDSTTYVITLSKEVKDFNEGNKMGTSYTYAFSTGDQLDSLQLNGQVANAWTNDGQEGIKVLLYPADEIEGNEIYGVRPVYATETDKDGNFKLQYLKAGVYKIYGIGDMDGSYSYNNEQEMLALLENPLLDLRDSSTLAKNHQLKAFFQDKTGPTVKSAKWVNANTIHLQLSEPIRTTFGSDTLSISVADTNGDNRFPIYLARTQYGSPTDIYLHSPLPNTEPINLFLFTMMDTLGTYTDTIMRIDPKAMSKPEQGALFDPPVFQIDKDRIMLLSYFQFPSSSDSLNVELVDTTGKQIDIDIEAYGFEASVQLGTLPDPKMPYKLRILPEFQRWDGSTLDSLVEFDMTFPSVADYGNVAGSIVADSTEPDAKWVMLLLGSGTPVAAPDASSRKAGGRKGGGIEVLKRFDGPGPYQLYRIAQGSYTVKYIKDDDGNGYFSPGSLDPYFMPEKVYIDPTAFEVKAKWDVEGFNLFPGEVRSAVESPVSGSKQEGGKDRSRGER